MAYLLSFEMVMAWHWVDLQGVSRYPCILTYVSVRNGATWIWRIEIPTVIDSIVALFRPITIVIADSICSPVHVTRRLRIDTATPLVPDRET